MRRLLHGIAAAGVAGMAALALTAPADAKTCSERLKRLPPLLHQERERLAWMRRQMRRVFPNVPRERLLGKQVRRQGMRPSPGSRRPRFRVHDEIADVLERDGR